MRRHLLSAHERVIYKKWNRKPHQRFFQSGRFVVHYDDCKRVINLAANGWRQGIDTISPHLPISVDSAIGAIKGRCPPLIKRFVQSVIIDSSNREAEIGFAAAESGDLRLATLVYKEFIESRSHFTRVDDLTGSILVSSAGFGHLRMMTLAKKWVGELPYDDALLEAVMHGKIKSIKLIERWVSKQMPSYTNMLVRNYMSEAAKFGKIKVMKYFEQKAIPYDFIHAISKASDVIKLPALRYLSKQITKRGKMIPANSILIGAAGGDNIEAMRFAIKFGANHLNQALLFASSNGKLRAMEFLIEQGARNLDEALDAARRDITHMPLLFSDIEMLINKWKRKLQGF